MLRRTFQSLLGFKFEQRKSAQTKVQDRRRNYKGLMPGQRPKGLMFDMKMRKPFRERIAARSLTGPKSVRLNRIFDKETFRKEIVSNQQKQLLNNNRAVKQLRNDKAQDAIHKKITTAKQTPWRSLPSGRGRL